MRCSTGGQHSCPQVIFPWHGFERIEVLPSDHFEFCNISKGSILLYGLYITIYLHLQIHILHTTSSGQSIYFGQELVVSTFEHLDCVLPDMYIVRYINMILELLPPLHSMHMFYLLFEAIKCHMKVGDTIVSSNTQVLWTALGVSIFTIWKLILNVPLPLSPPIFIHTSLAGINPSCQVSLPALQP